MTTTALAAYGRVQDMQSFIRELGENIALSQMFGCENKQQGFVLATACVAKNKDPLTLAEDYHIIKGKLSMRADRMLAGLQERGGKYRVIQRTADGAEIEITYDGQTQRFSLTWEDAQKESFPYGKDGKKLKDNWSTPRSRTQMMWARVVSDGVRVMCPIVLSGRYTPEEISDMDDSNGQVVEAEYVVVPPVPPVAAPSGVAPAAETPRGSAVHATIAKIRTLYDALAVPHEKQDEILQRYGAGALIGLSQEQAEEILAKLEGLAARQTAATAAAPAGSEPEPVVVDGPCSQELSDKIKSLLAELAQSFDREIASKVKQKLTDAGLAKIADLTLAEAEGLLSALQSRQTAAFFEASLTGYKPKN